MLSNSSTTTEETPRRIVILDFGSQYSHLIVRRCREIGAYSELMRCDVPLDTLRKEEPVGIILSGGPCSVYAEDAPHVASGFWDYVTTEKIPVLGVCYGMQEMQRALGGTVEASNHREYGHAILDVLPVANAGCDVLFAAIPSRMSVWMSHGDRVISMAPGFQAIAKSGNSPFAAAADVQRRFWGVQFHPEVTHTSDGQQILTNFVDRICGAAMTWDMSIFAHMEIPKIRQQVGDRHVIGALSGGVDSTVAAALMHAAIGDRFHGFMVDTGLLRKHEGPEVISRLRKIFPGLQVELIDGRSRFFTALKGVTEPEQKRKIIGHCFIECFVEAVDKLKSLYPSGTFANAYLLQGTLYPDVIESLSFKGPSQTIKTHHNVGGLPEKMALKLIEPLRELFKDEVRKLGLELGLEHDVVWRHPFPGPGLAIRIIGEVTQERADILKEADSIFIEEIRASGDYEKIGQALVVLLPDCRSVGVMGDQRTYGMTAVLRAVETSDYMTADWYEMPREVLQRCSTRLINEVPPINRVVYDISSKPPATIEWE